MNDEEEYEPESFNYANGRKSKKPYEAADPNDKHVFNVSNEILSHLAGNKPNQTFPLLKSKHTNWEHLQEYLAEYEKKHFVKLALKSSNTVQWFNNKYKDTTKSPFPDEYEYYRKSFICTHGWGAKSRGKNNRMSHVRNTDCKAMFNAQLVRIGGEIYVQIFKQETTHNHLCNIELYSMYHEQRRVIDSETLGVVDKMVEYKMERGKIWQYIRSQGKNKKHMK